MRPSIRAVLEPPPLSRIPDHSPILSCALGPFRPASYVANRAHLISASASAGKGRRDTNLCRIDVGHLSSPAKYKT